MVCSLKAQVSQVWLSKSLEQNVGALSRFSAGISVSSPEGQKEMIAQAKLTIKTRRAHLLLSKFRPHGP